MYYTLIGQVIICPKGDLSKIEEGDILELYNQEDIIGHYRILKIIICTKPKQNIKTIKRRKTRKVGKEK